MLTTLSKELTALGCFNRIGLLVNAGRFHGGFAELAGKESVAVEPILCRGRFDRRAAAAIQELVRVHSIDLLHSHGYKADFYAWWAAHRQTMPLVATCHNWTRASTALKLYSILDHIVLRHFCKVAAVSEGVAQSLQRYGVPRRRIEVIHNGVDTDAFRGASARLRAEVAPGGECVIGTVGRLVPQKGIQYLLRAACQILKDFPATVFVIVGDGPYRHELETLADVLQIRRNAIFLGQRQDMPEVYAAMDLFVLPSLNEGMPMSVLEALAAGKAVIATSAGDIPEVVVPGKTGLIVEPGSEASLREAITNLLSDPELRGKMGQAGQALVEQGFSARAMARAYMRLYEWASKSDYLHPAA